MYYFIKSNNNETFIKNVVGLMGCEIHNYLDKKYENNFSYYENKMFNYYTFLKIQQYFHTNNNIKCTCDDNIILSEEKMSTINIWYENELYDLNIEKVEKIL